MSREKPRKYELKRRAESQERTRRRLTEAAVELHGTVGPAHTSLSEVARRAGVQRATLYRHFPTEADLLQACTSHYMSLNPPPDPGRWAAIKDPSERLRIGLEELYEYYARTQAMFTNTIRDENSSETIRRLMAPYWQWLDAVRASLVAGRRERGKRRERVRAAVGHAVELETWRSLVRSQGLDAAAAADLMTRLVGAASVDSPPDGRARSRRDPRAARRPRASSRRAG